MDLDEVDLLLIRELQNDCKTPLSKLGERVGLTASSVLERIRKLEQTGVIKGYHALVDARKLGLDVTAFIGVSLNYPRMIGAFEKGVASEPGVLECHHLTGSYTMLLKVRARNTGSLEELLSRIRALDGVDRTETMVVLSTRSERVSEPLEIDTDHEARARRRLRSKGEHDELLAAGGGATGSELD